MNNTTKSKRQATTDILLAILIAAVVILSMVTVLPLICAQYIPLYASNGTGTYYDKVPLIIDIPLGTKIYYTTQSPDSDRLSKESIFQNGKEYTGTCFVTGTSRVSAVAVFQIGPNMSISEPLYLDYTIIRNDDSDEQNNIVFETEETIEELEERSEKETAEDFEEQFENETTEDFEEQFSEDFEEELKEETTEKYEEEFIYVNTYTWYDGINEWTTTIYTPSSLYDKCRRTSYLSSGGHIHKEYANSQLCREYVRGIAEDFRAAAEAEGYTEQQLLTMVIRFVQSIPYELDKISMGQGDYPRFSAETLVDGLGDCEDTSVLLAELLMCMGYDTTLLISTNHAMLGVAGGDFSGSYITHDGISYYVLETTGEGFDIGEYDADSYDYHSYSVYNLY